MRTVKLLAVALMLALAGAVYGAGAMQDTAKQQGETKAAKSCCQMHGKAKAADTHAGMKHEGEGCCGGGGGCCVGGACAKEHKGAHAAATRKTAAADKKAGCCSGDTGCCAGGACAKGHKDAKTQAVAVSGESCCKEGAACCKEGATCCKTHKADAGQTVAKAVDSKGTAAASCCGGSSCACCGDKDSHKTHTGGQ